MATRQLPDAELLRKLLRYDPETGKLYWRERTPDMFKPSRRFKPSVKAAQWNTRHAGQVALGHVTESGYLRGIVNGHKVYAHRVAWVLFYGAEPTDQIDHINRDRADNRIANLREVSRSDNLKNTKLYASNSSGRIGVHHHQSGLWSAYIGHQGKKHLLGYYKTRAEAVRAREDAEIRFGYHPNHGRAA